MSLATAASVPPPNSTANTTVASSSTSSQHQSGDVLLFSTRTLTVANVIQAHKSPLSFLSINSTGSLLATSSDKGTVIRVWSIPGAEKLYQFRRGTREAKIYSMNFNLVSTLLAVSSVHDTVHIFKLGTSKNGGETSNGSPSSANTSESTDGGASPPASLEGGYDTFIEKKKVASISYVSISYNRFSGSDCAVSLSSRSSFNRRSLQLTKTLTHSMGGYLPNSLTEMWEPSRDFAFLRLPTSGTRSIVAFSG